MLSTKALVASSGLLRNCENFADGSFSALLHYSGCMYLRLWSGSQLEVLGEEKHHALDAAAGQPLGRQREPRVADLSSQQTDITDSVGTVETIAHPSSHHIYGVKLSRVRLS